MTAAAMRLGVKKELRALAGPWLACVAAIVVPALVSERAGVHNLIVPAYVIGMASLGALSLGNEYIHRTLAVLLVQPVGP